MKVAVIDDEINSRELLETLLMTYCKDSVTSVTTASSASEGVALINSFQPDIIFLDIEMPGGNGFSLLDAFRKAHFLTCFTTGYEKYALQAIKYGAFGYLLKPLDISELKEIVAKAKTKINELDDGSKNDSIIISENEVYHVINYREILQVEASGNYTYIHVDKGQKILSDKRLSEYEQLLPDSKFFKVHRSHIVNLSKISRFVEGRTGVAILQNQVEVPIANRRLKGFLAAFRP